MPILKQLQLGALTTSLHKVSSVEFHLVNGALSCRGRYLSYRDGDSLVRPESSGTVTAVTLPELNGDPIAAFEIACVATPGCVFYGGVYVAPGSPTATLEMEKTQAWTRVKLARDAHLDAGVTTSVGTFDSDLNTLVNVLGAAATTPDGGSRGWILADHTPVVLTKAQVLELGAALATLRDTSYSRGSTLYAQIQAAQTVEEVRAVVWTPPA